MTGRFQIVRLLLLVLAVLAFIAPRHGKAAIVEVTGEQAVFHYQDDAGSGAYRWTAPGTSDASWYGDLVLEPDHGPPIRWGRGRQPVWAKPASFLGAHWQRTSGGAVLVSRYRLGERTAKIELSVRIEGRSLLVDADADTDAIEQIDFSGWEPCDCNQALSVPYSLFPYFRNTRSNLFLSSYFDWVETSATRQYFPLLQLMQKTDGTRNKLHSRLIVLSSPRLEGVFPPAPAQRSRYFDDVAGHLFIDVLTTEHFGSFERGVDKLIAGGLRDCTFLIHVWQFHGYDDGFPSHVPANPELGGNVYLTSMSRKLREVGCRFALHENYTDYYEDYPGFNRNDVSLDSDGALEAGYFNDRKGLKSYQAKPSRYVLLAGASSPSIHSLFATNAGFIDVVSAMVPWWYYDLDASVESAPSHLGFRDGGLALFHYLQTVHEGPVFGEGAAHFFWTGFLDGVEAQLNIGYRGQGEDIPLLVNFDLQRIHDAQANQGMGYYQRWSAHERGDWSQLPIEHDIELRDLYRTQEIAYGHTPYRSGTNWSDPSRLAEEAGLAIPVATAYGHAHAADIRYLVEGNWVPVERAVPTAAYSAVRVDYDNGLRIIANVGRAPIEVDGLSIPYAGWSARGADVTAFTALRDGRKVAFADGPTSLYADARRSAEESAPLRVDFGVVKTDGAIWLTCRNGTATLIGYPTGSPIFVEFDTDRFPPPQQLDGSPIHIDGLGHWETTLAGGQAYSWTPCSSDRPSR